MSASGSGRYTAKLVDGPLEGKTVSTQFANDGDPQARIEIPAGSGKSYLYTRGAGLEFDPAGDRSDKPTAVDYRFVQAIVD
jgi:hypothetical protein